MNKSQTMPIFVASGTNNNISTYEGLIKFALKENDVDLNHEIRTTGIIAEDLFEKLTSIEFVFGTQVNWRNGTGDVRLEAWKDSNIAYLYKFSNVGYRELIKYPLEDLSHALKEIEEFVSMYGTQPYTESFSYRSMEEREKKNNKKIVLQ